MGAGRTRRRRQQAHRLAHERAYTASQAAAKAEAMVGTDALGQAIRRATRVEHWHVAFSPEEIALIEKGRLAHG
jgi:hypothetical protein